ncbi:MAG: dissimilatory sulfite reductase related protein [Clostridia bacterium]|jgi:sulfur relay (sulfurtransferase) DsrC/TusE family protein|nr:dsrC [Clostridiales bacterium]MDK2985439.1 dissimilatory sulfite reductase related protein [Clostridia bacterium]
MLPSSLIRRRYLAKGPRCIKDEKIWDELVNDVLTKLENITTVTSEHHQVMSCVRKYYLDKERAPTVREICSATGFSLDKFFDLFPDWPHTLFNIDCIVCTVLGIPYWNCIE